ncbi:hypothetical protein [Flavobacterium sp. PL002]|uniref:hypothetical protein n=1 Tax=Flavobacterium sp. PL002 TaxID=1897058 RepID=UPI00178812D7|nr:hypothetical protein [Flavobacterium sp. PL002]MBE0392850.1 hypothetical protein [Flavobacterium sp. PL002]
MENKVFNLKQFVIITLITSIWIHIAEVARAMFVAFPLMEKFFAGRIPIGAMEVSNALIWGIWDTLLSAVLVFIFWLCSVAFGNNLKSIIISGTTTAFATIGIFWIASVNTGLGVWSTAAILFPIAWAEMIIGAFIASKLYSKNK